MFFFRHETVDVRGKLFSQLTDTTEKGNDTGNNGEERVHRDEQSVVKNVFYELNFHSFTTIEIP